MDKDTQRRTETMLDALMDHIHENAIAHGWWEGERNPGELIALIHSELSEGLEALRRDLVSEHIPGFKGIEEELADVIIRVLDMAGGLNLRVAEAIIAKHEFNRTRPYKHGKKF